MNEDIAEPSNPGLDLLLHSLRKVLQRHGYTGEQLEQKIVELQQRDFPRLTAAIMPRPKP